MSEGGWSADSEGVGSAGPTRAEWEAVPDDPDPLHDLGYDRIELEVFETDDGTDRILVLPMNESMLADDAFIVADPGAVCDLGSKI